VEMTTGETFRTGGLPGTTHTRQPYPIGVAACELQCRLASRPEIWRQKWPCSGKIQTTATENHE